MAAKRRSLIMARASGLRLDAMCSMVVAGIISLRRGAADWLLCGHAFERPVFLLCRWQGGPQSCVSYLQGGTQLSVVWKAGVVNCSFLFWCSTVWYNTAWSLHRYGPSKLGRPSACGQLPWLCAQQHRRDDPHQPNGPSVPHDFCEPADDASYAR